MRGTVVSWVPVASSGTNRGTPEPMASSFSAFCPCLARGQAWTAPNTCASTSLSAPAVADLRIADLSHPSISGPERKFSAAGGGSARV